MISHLKILNLLQQLSLKSYPNKEIKALINKLGTFPISCEGLYLGDELIRARRNEDGESYICRKDLSYLPEKLNTKYQRASTPINTMFYACPLKRNHLKSAQPRNIDDIRLVACLETSELLKNDIDGDEPITFSRWQVTNTMSLCAMYFHNDFMIDGTHEKEVNKNFLTEIHKLGSELSEKSTAILTFFSNEFAKEIKDEAKDYNYMISAIFSEMMIDFGKAGIHYPSVKTKYTEKVGLNVAISPSTVDSSLRLISSIECTLYKRGKEVFIDNEMIATIDDDKKCFKYVAVPSDDHVGKEKVLAFLEKEAIRKNNY